MFFTADLIPEEFRKFDIDQPVAKNVGELIEQLKKLPVELPIECGDGVELTVYNVGSSEAFLGLTECRDEDEDDDDWEDDDDSWDSDDEDEDLEDEDEGFDDFGDDSEDLEDGE